MNTIDFSLNKLGGKWDSVYWSTNQFVKHLDEVESLFNNKDSHLMSEVIDLLAIASHLKYLGLNSIVVDDSVSIWSSMSKSNIPDSLIESRYQKFITNSKKDIK